MSTKKPSLVARLLKFSSPAPAPAPAPMPFVAPLRPEWINGQRAPVRRPFPRHEASCFERPPVAYGPHYFTLD